MNRSVKRSAKAAVPGINASLALTDDVLIRRVLALPIGDRFRAELEVTLSAIEPGKYGQIRRSSRDQLMKFALQNGAIPKHVQPKKHGLTASCHVDTYNAKETPGTGTGAAIIAAQVPKYGGAMPVPPGRKPL